MAICIYGDDLHIHSELSHQMFSDRALQFHHRLRWNVTINEFGEEKDEYDLLSPLYLIDTDQFGKHRGSMRFLPTSGDTMMADHFPALAASASFHKPLVWECTRFCLAPNHMGLSAQRLLAFGAIIMREFRLDAFVAIYDARMERVYKRLGALPERLGEMTDLNGNTIRSGLWRYSDNDYQKLLGLAGVTFGDLEFIPRSQISMMATAYGTGSAKVSPDRQRSKTLDSH